MSRPETDTDSPEETMGTMGAMGEGEPTPLVAVMMRRRPMPGDPVWYMDSRGSSFRGVVHTTADVNIINIQLEYPYLVVEGVLHKHCFDRDPKGKHPYWTNR